jgi:hypothetical protein
MPKIISGLGFEILKTGNVVRDGSDEIEYGYIAQKR